MITSGSVLGVLDWERGLFWASLAGRKEGSGSWKGKRVELLVWSSLVVPMVNMSVLGECWQADEDVGSVRLVIRFCQDNHL